MSEDSKEQVGNPKQEQPEAENSGDEGFYNQGGNEQSESDEDIEAPGRKIRKAKHIKKRKKRGELSSNNLCNLEK